MGRKDRYQTRLDADHAERVDQYRDDHDLTQAEAVRRLILTGLDVEEGNATVPADEIRRDLDELRDELADNHDDEDDDRDDGPQVAVYRQMGGKRLGSLGIAAGVVGILLLDVSSTGPVTVAAAVSALLLGVLAVLGVSLILYGLWPVLNRTGSAENREKPGVSRPDGAD
jgi:predicted phage tail protein